MNPREAILGRVRQGLRRGAGEAVPEPPPVRICVPEMPVAERIERFTAALEALAGKVFVAGDADEARAYVNHLLEGGEAVASDAPLLEELGITSLERVRRREPGGGWKAQCAAAAVGITSASYALADTGSLVMIAARNEARLASLLPPVHVAVIRREQILTGLDEFLQIEPLPAAQTSSTVFITGPSRTADIEQILVRGVHGPGVIHVVIV